MGIKILYYITLNYFYLFQFWSYCNKTDKNTIILEINNIGVHKILSDFYENLPSEIYLNGEKQEISRNININYFNEKNTIIMVWNKTIDDCRQCFINVAL